MVPVVMAASVVPAQPRAPMVAVDSAVMVARVVKALPVVLVPRGLRPVLMALTVRPGAPVVTPVAVVLGALTVMAARPRAVSMARPGLVAPAVTVAPGWRVLMVMPETWMVLVAVMVALVVLAAWVV
ncbi:hypothetical protein MSEN_39840 [Mycolicibacter senuensis]|uniref:Uncharacterized protein n=1 Tax=Mycolicibacter senuensis TaxID=386913 RepID=A0A7I9XQQ7_9MYCO|nr:hypothetical protein MSEN_39840 [Mycolicibacter senuensis]